VEGWCVVKAGCRGYCLSQKEHRARGVAAPRKESIAPSSDLCKTDSVTEVEYGTVSRQIDTPEPRVSSRLCMGAKPTTRLESFAGCCDRVSRGGMTECVVRFPRECCLGVRAEVARMTQPRTGNVGRRPRAVFSQIQADAGDKTCHPYPTRTAGVGV
jgi:hypothetical protein